ncbi:MAG: hypothetical protein Q3972_02185 [Corynebacterium sp.]|nr:hypothetical protein [Corynebacterium sp.]
MFKKFAQVLCASALLGSTVAVAGGPQASALTTKVDGSTCTVTVSASENKTLLEKYNTAAASFKAWDDANKASGYETSSRAVFEYVHGDSTLKAVDETFTIKKSQLQAFVEGTGKPRDLAKIYNNSNLLVSARDRAKELYISADLLGNAVGSDLAANTSSAAVKARLANLKADTVRNFGEYGEYNLYLMGNVMTRCGKDMNFSVAEIRKMVEQYAISQGLELGFSTFVSDEYYFSSDYTDDKLQESIESFSSELSSGSSKLSS